jgi:hypothetical protein
VWLTATADVDSVFAGWSGAATGTSDTISVRITSGAVITATFGLLMHTLTVATDGTGSGLVDPPVGDHVYDHGTTVWLTATADVDSVFAGWSGAATGTSDAISVTMTGDAVITATFDLLTHTLTVAADGTGSGLVDPPVGDHLYDHGTTVWLTATADVGSVFAGWSGALSGATNPTSVIMDAHKLVTATFTSAVCKSLDRITISGSATGVPGIYTFTTSYLPEDATLPITYLWDNGDTVSATARTLWPGAYTLTITATNCTSTLVTDSHAISVRAEIYLPVVLRRY